MKSRTPRSAAVLAVALTSCAAAPTLPAAMPSALQQSILRDAAQRSGVPPGALAVVSAAAVTWRDGAMGCPAPGLMAVQALVPGWRLELAAPGQTPQLYHASRGGGWLWCPRDRAQEPLPADPRL